MAVPAKEVRWGLVAEVLTSYKHAVMLARGITAAEQAEIDQSPNRTERLRERETRKVPREDMEAAYLIATEVRAAFVEWQSRYYTVPWPGHREFAVHTTMNAASDATRHLVEQTRWILDGSPPGAGQVRSLQGAWPLIWLQWLYTAFEPLQIIEGELPLPEAAIGQPDEVLHDFADYVLSSIPVIGEFVLSYEALLGYQFVGGRKLSKPEQLLAFLGLVIPPVLGALVKQIPRVGIALRAFRVNLARRIPGSVASKLDRFTVDMVIALRAFPKESFDKFLGIIRTVGRLSPQQQSDLAFYLSRLNYASRLAQWLKIIERDLGTGFSGVRALKRPLKPVPRPHERAMMEDLSRLSNKRVVSIPEMHPQDYDGFAAKLAVDPKAKMPTQVDGVKYADTVWGAEFAELYRAERADTTDKVLNAISKQGKGKQASTLVVAKSPELSVDLVSVVDNRFWAKPSLLWIDKVVILQNNTIKIIERPVRYITMDPRAYALTRVLIGNPAHLVKTADEVIRAQEEERRATPH
ncbi:hypothetical protein [Streptomyces sp. NPDC046727]|uniref:hypothetical protein n=1 Tax=Streptomyces sp. NPDC046727 TaxID=3155373 RepID=UPI00340BFCC8